MRLKNDNPKHYQFWLLGSRSLQNIIIIVIVIINRGRIADAKFYSGSGSDTGDFDLSPFVVMNPIDTSLDESASPVVIHRPSSDTNFINSGTAGGAVLSPMSGFSQDEQASMNMMAMAAAAAAGAAAADRPIIGLDSTTLTIPSRRVDSSGHIDVPYDVQANQLLDYLNSARLISPNGAAAASVNYANPPSDFDNAIHRSAQAEASTSEARVESSTTTITPSLGKNRFESIVNRINSTNRVIFDEAKKAYRLVDQLKKSPDGAVDAVGVVKCFNCSIDMTSANECRDMQEIEYFELINMFCCECYANIKENSSGGRNGGWESVFKDIVRKTKENSQFRTNFIIAVLVLFGVFCLSLIVAITVCIYQLMRGRRRRGGGLAGCVSGGRSEESGSSSSSSSSGSSSEWSSSETSISRETGGGGGKKDVKGTSSHQSGKKTSVDASNKNIELGERASVHSIADSLDDQSDKHRRQSSLVTAANDDDDDDDKFPSEAPPLPSSSTRRYVNMKTAAVPVVKRTCINEENRSTESAGEKKEQTKAFHFSLKKSSK